MVLQNVILFASGISLGVGAGLMISAYCDFRDLCREVERNCEEENNE